jgi:protease-4
VYAVGAIVPGQSGDGLMGGTVGSATLVKALRKAADDDQVKAIVLRVDSPGGSATASDMIWREVVRIDKPVVASMGNVAASGGYYISMGAEKIYAEPGTLTGSIGVIGGKLVLQGLYDKIGLSTETISRGVNSGVLSSTEPFSASERQAWEQLMQTTYRQFVDKAARGRKMDVEQLEALAQGRVFSGRMAAANGLVDALGTLHDAVAEAKRRAGLEEDEPVELLMLPEPKSVFEQLFGSPAVLAPTPGLRAVPELSPLLQQADLYRRLFREPALLLMPYQVDLR